MYFNYFRFFKEENAIMKKQYSFRTVISISVWLTSPFVWSISDFDNYLNRISNNQSNLANLSLVHTITSQYEERTIVDSFVYAVINYTYLTADGTQLPNSSEQGRYGEGKVQGAHGVLVHVTKQDNSDDHTACTHEIVRSNSKALPSKGWIALVKRGKCTFEDKVQNVWLKGAVGIIVYNDKSSKELEKMQIRDKQREFNSNFFVHS